MKITRVPASRHDATLTSANIEHHISGRNPQLARTLPRPQCPTNSQPVTTWLAQAGGPVMQGPFSQVNGHK